MSTPNAKRPGRPVDPAKRTAILDAATRRFFDEGFAATSIEQVAQDASVSKVTIYNQFHDKPGLFAAAVERECERMRGYFSIGVPRDAPLRERLLTIGSAMIAFLSRPEMIQFERRIAAETEHDPAIGVTFMANGPNRMKRAFAGLLEAMREAGEVELDDPELAAEQFASMCKGFGDLERRFGLPGDEARDRKRLESAVDVFCSAYAAKGGCA